MRCDAQLAGRENPALEDQRRRAEEELGVGRAALLVDERSEGALLAHQLPRHRPRDVVQAPQRELEGGPPAVLRALGRQTWLSVTGRRMADVAEEGVRVRALRGSRQVDGDLELCGLLAAQRREAGLAQGLEQVRDDAVLSHILEEFAPETRVLQVGGLDPALVGVIPPRPTHVVVDNAPLGLRRVDGLDLEALTVVPRAGATGNLRRRWVGLHVRFCRCFLNNSDRV